MVNGVQAGVTASNGRILLKNSFGTISNGITGVIKPLTELCQTIAERPTRPVFLKPQFSSCQKEFFNRIAE